MALAAMDTVLKVIEADVPNAFLYGKNKVKTMIRAGPEFVDVEGQYLIVEGGWYGHKTAVSTFSCTLGRELEENGVLLQQRQTLIHGYEEHRMGVSNIWHPTWMTS
jgi:hypothetical protein